MGTDINLWPGFSNPADVRNTQTGAGSGGNVYTANLSDTVAGLDALVRQFIGARGQTDALTTTDADGRKVTIQRAPNDTAPATDSTARRWTGGRGPTDAVAGTDATARRTTQARALADAVLGTDAVTKQLRMVRGVAESLTTNDTAGRLARYARSIGDALAGLVDLVGYVYTPSGPPPPPLDATARLLPRRWSAVAASTSRWGARSQHSRTLAIMPSTPKYTATAQPRRWSAKVLENRP